MKIHDCIQGSDEWLMARLAIPTASEFFNFTAPATGKYRTGRKADAPSQMVQSYIARLIAEDVTTWDPPTFASPWMERGHALEAEAIAEYELQHGVTCKRVGFITNNGAGCSPDALVDDDGLLEIKCPSAAKMVLHMMGGDAVLPAEYAVQAHGQLVVTERQWVVCKIYHPELPPLEIRTERNEYTDQVEANLERFQNELTDTKARLQTRYEL